MSQTRLPAPIEIAPGIFVPDEKYADFLFEAQRNDSVASMIADMHTVLTEVAPSVFVERQNIAAWEKRMNSEPEFCAAMDVLMDAMNQPELADASIVLTLTPEVRFVLAQQPERHSHSVQSFAVSYGNH